MVWRKLGLIKEIWGPVREVAVFFVEDAECGLGRKLRKELSYGW